MTREVVDVHAHWLPEAGLVGIQGARSADLPGVVTEGDQRFLQFESGRKTGPFRRGFFDIASRLEDMTEMRIDHQVLSAPPFVFYYDVPVNEAVSIVRHLNDGMIEASSQSQGRLSFLASLPMQSVGASIDEISRVAAFPAARGVVVGSSVVGRDLDGDEFVPLWESLVRHDLAVFIHPPIDVIGGDRVKPHFLRNLYGNPSDTTLAVARLILSGVLERHPTLRIGLSHGGGSSACQIGRWDHGWRTRPEVASELPHPPSYYLRRLHFDTIVHDDRALEFLALQVGWSQLLIGTDYPFAMGAFTPVEDVERLSLPTEDEVDVFNKNSSRFLRASDAIDRTSV